MHQYAISAIDDTQARQRLALLYFAKPIDRLIQAVAAPFFRLADDLLGIHEFYQIEAYGAAAMMGIVFVLKSPIQFALGLIEAVGLIVNGALQTVFPYQALYAICKGKEASSEYFDYRHFLLERLDPNTFSPFKDGYPFAVIFPLKHLSILSEVQQFSSPKESYQDLFIQFGRRHEQIGDNSTLLLAMNIGVGKFAPPALTLVVTACNIAHHHAHPLLLRLASAP